MPILSVSSFMVSPRRLAAALSSVSGLPLRSSSAAPLFSISVVRWVVAVVAVVMSLPPEMKKRDGPLIGDSPARFRVPVVGTVSVNGLVAVSHGRCGAPTRDAVCVANPDQGQRSWAGPVLHRAQVFPVKGVWERTCPMAVGLGGRGMEARTVRAGWGEKVGPETLV